MNKETFLIIFSGKYIFLLCIIIFIIVRYIRKGMIRINTSKMIECKLKKICEKNYLWINILINLILCLMVGVSFIEGVVPAMRDIPYVIKMEFNCFEGKVIQGSNVDSRNKMEQYNILLSIDGNEEKLYIYGKNGIRTGDHIKIEYLPHSKEGILIENAR